MNEFLLVSLFIMAAVISGNAASVFEIKSSAFQDHGRIPAKYTGDSLDVSPPLSWSNAPSATKSFAIICDDPDAPSKIWIHWVIYNIPKEKKGLDENVPRQVVLTDGSMQGVNSGGETGYSGPYPPPGKPHRYFFKIYALDAMLNPGRNPTKADIEQAIKGHILGDAHIVGLYQH